MNILAIDTSCDETSVAILKDGNIVANLLPSQMETHRQWGGVVPAIAKRMHEEIIDQVIIQALKHAHLSIQEIDYIAVTIGPGLAIALEVGVRKAKELSFKHSIPLIPINHMEGHIYSTFAKNAAGKGHIMDIAFPYLSLLISGGHTELHIMHDHGSYEKLGEKLDDAVGEAYDKAGRMIEIGYPGGPILEKFARLGSKDTYPLPIPLLHDHSMNFSYSGLKTALQKEVMRLKEQHAFHKQAIYDLAASFQYSAVCELVNKTTIALQKHPYVHGLLLGGGVSANLYVRHELRKVCKTFSIPLYTPLNKVLCMDNAAMIGTAAYWHVVTNNLPPVDIQTLDRNPRLSL